MVETVEAFCAEHKVDIDTVLYDWPASKFEGLYEAMARRKIADDLNQRRSLNMASIMSAQFEKSEHRQEALESIDENYSNAIMRLYGDDEEIEEEIDPDDPFFKAMNKGLAEQGLPTVNY